LRAESAQCRTLTGVLLALCIGFLLAALVAMGVALWLRRGRARRAARQPRLRHPVVLAHGVLGFDKIAFAGKDHSYFRGVTGHLTRVGAEVHKPCVPSAASIAVRAEELARLIRMIPAKKVNVIAHSMGGLDVRYAIARHGLADRVASLITIGTPHHGTPVADLGLKLTDLLKLQKLIGRVVDVSGFQDLTTERMKSFNQEIADHRKVVYGSVVARIDRSRAHPLLWPTHLYLSERGQESDGLVPAASQRWGEVLREVDADHWGQIGWSNGFDALALYEDLLLELRGRGF
jgi:triacylglycerol lipase